MNDEIIKIENDVVKTSLHYRFFMAQVLLTITGFVIVIAGNTNIYERVLGAFIIFGGGAVGSKISQDAYWTRTLGKTSNFHIIVAVLWSIAMIINILFII